jgi:predicted ferric reductase
MRYFIRGLFWIGVYLGLALFPCLILLYGTMPGGYGFWWDFSMALGFAAASMMALMFFLTARFKRAALPFGVDIIYYFHKYISLLLFFIAAGHAVILLSTERVVWEMLGPAKINRYMAAGIVSFILLGFIVCSSLWRKQLQTHYDNWRMLHVFLAVATFILALVHIEGVGYYIATPAKRIIWGTIMGCWLLLLLYVRLIKPVVLRSRPYSVKEIIPERGNAHTMVIVPEQHRGIHFLPGQFVWLSMYHSPLSMKEHPFSISSAPEQKGELHFTIKELGDFTRRIKDTPIGQPVYIDGPYGAFSIDRHPSAQGYVFIAGGIGIAPIRSMLCSLAARRDDRSHILFFAGSTLEKLTFYEELNVLKARMDLKTVYLLEHPPSHWQGESGFLTAGILKRHLPYHLQELNYFICGPVPMVELAERELHKMGIPLQHLHSELFDFV